MDGVRGAGRQRQVRSGPTVSRRRRCGADATLRRFFVAGLLGGGLLAGACSAPGGGNPEAEALDDDGREAADSAAVAGQIREMLGSSARAWNAGNLDGFLDDYTTDPSLTFVTGAGVLEGLEALRDRYRRTYWSPGIARDSLRFEQIRVRPLGRGYALAFGRYVLYRPRSPQPDSVTGTGRFSLVLQEEARGWKILHDHSSAAPEGEDG